MNKCKKCGRIYEPTPNQIKNRQSCCNVCRSKRDKAWRDHRKATNRPYAVSRPSKEWEDKYRKRRAELMRKYYYDPVRRARYLARAVTTTALKSGKIARLPCSQCGAENAQKHHPDYSKPLDIVWLCPICHRALHAQLNAQQPESFNKLCKRITKEKKSKQL